MLFVSSHSTASPYVVPSVYGGGSVPWSEAAPHIAQRLHWTEPSFKSSVHFADELREGSAARASFEADAAQADMLVCVGVHDATEAASLLASRAAGIPCCAVFDCAPALAAASRLHFQPEAALVQALQFALPWGRANRDAALLETARSLFARGTPSDFTFALLLLLDAAVAPVTTLTVNKSTTPANVLCMARNCGSEVLACVSDPTCKAALDCLTACGLNDQVCSYRCITSYETPLFEGFSLCVLQKHNCLGNHAERPLLPAQLPMRRFRGAPLTHEAAEAILTGYLGVRGSLAPPETQLAWSWKVVSGQNPAYDFFSSQHQLFYPGKGKAFWYSPVFRVQLFDGTFVWRRRQYRVRRGAEPGRFVLSVLDNGVTSMEHWAIIDAADNLSWGLFAYSGAAAAAGQQYSGAVLVTPDGAWPAAAELARVREAHQACGIELFELHEVDNSPEASQGAPLQLEV